MTTQTFQVLEFDPTKGPGIPVPNWMKVTDQDANKVLLEGSPPDDPPNVYRQRRNIKIRLIFRFQDGGLKKMAYRYMSYEMQHYKDPTKWERCASGNQVLASRMITNLLNHSRDRNFW